MRVSVIIPFLNAERFFEETLRSVFAQTFPSWELLLVDDGSTDGSTAIARRYAEQHPDRVRYLEHPGHGNRGQAASRNLGLAHARGEFIAPLDADDLWLPHKLAEQVALLEAQPRAAALHGSAFWWYSWTGKPEDQGRDRMDTPGFPSGVLVEPPAVLTGCLNQMVPMPLLTTMLFRRSIAERIGGFVDEFRNPFEDQAFLTKLLLEYPVLPSDACWARYRRHSDSVSVVARENGEMARAEAMYLRWTAAYLAERGLRKTDVWKALEARRWRYRHPHLARLRSRVASLPGRLRGRLGRVLPV